MGRKKQGDGGSRRGSFLERHIYLLFLISYFGAVITVYLADPFLLQALRLIAFDGYQRIAPLKHDRSLPVQVVDIDERSLAQVGQWPWPRQKLAGLVDQLRERGASAVVFDVMFSEPDRTSPEQLKQWLTSEQAAQLSTLIESWTPNDNRLVQAISAVPTVLAVTLTSDGGNGALPAKAGFAIAGDDPRPFLTADPGLVGNLPALTDAAAGLGAINWIPDRDQVVRRVPLVFRVGETLVPSLAAEALRVAQGASTFIIKASNASGETAFGRASGVNHIKIGAYDVPTDADGALWLKFRPSDSKSFLPAWRVLQGEVDPSEVQGKIILIGTSASGLTDLRATPLETAVPGVEVHQQILEHILSGQSLTRPDYAPMLELAIILALGLLLATLLPMVSPSVAAFSCAAAVALLNGASWWAYAFKGLLFDPLYPSICTVVLVGCSTFYLYFRTEARRAEVRRAFSQYVAPEVVQQLIAHPEQLVLGGEVRELTILFMDVRSFTKLSEGLSAEQLTKFINELLTPLSDIIMAHRGTIDKYMGDAIMAFWNAPLDDRLHARNACDTAIAMVREMTVLNARWGAIAKAEGRSFQPVSIGIGLNTGACCVGNLGSTQRFDYSAIGDDVNVASRFEGLTKQYGLTLLAGEDTAGQVKDRSTLEVDLVRVKGRDLPSRVYTFLEVFDLETHRRPSLLSAHKALLAYYRKQEWSEAREALALCRGFGVADLEPLYALYEARIANYKLSPPPADWDGVYTAEEK